MLMSYRESLKILHSHTKPFARVERIALTECLGRILAQDIKASKNQPEFPASAMDGYAIKLEDQDKPLKILDLTPAGTMPEFKVENNACVKTFAGSLMSEGSDTLVPVKNVRVGKNTLFIEKKASKGLVVREIGENYKKGEILLRKSTELSYSEIVLLAELGFFHISVFIKPIVGVLSSGSEIKDLGEVLENPTQIRSPNHIAIASLAKNLNCDTRVFPLLKDDEKATFSILESALQSYDILVTTGGVSMGDLDFLRKAVKEYEIIIDKADIRPDRHIKIAKANEKFIIALPGFPRSAMIMFNFYTREILSSWLLQPKDYICKAFLQRSYKRKTPYLEFIACNVEFKNGRILVSLEGKKEDSSAIISSLNDKAALMVVPKECEILGNENLVDITFMS